ncbi:MAG: ABC-2 family transporter protein [Treponema sp.]|jgi:ABC-2 type transport system permease protein|nr:ABC-2 family transporter protein [Treponema sp.]
MRKFLAVSKLYFKIQVAYRLDVIMRVLSVLGRTAFAWVLWGAVYSGRSEVGGMSFQAMVSYYVARSVLAAMVDDDPMYLVSNYIRDGAFSKYMVLPINIQGFFLFRALGFQAFMLLFNLLSAALAVLVFGIQFSLSTDLVQIFCALGMMALGLVFRVSYGFCLGILAFKFQDIRFFRLMQDNIVEFISGALIPLTLLPAALTGFLRFLPFYYIPYLPAMLLTGQAGDEALPGLAILACWTGLMLFITQKSYHRLRVKYDGAGI